MTGYGVVERREGRLVHVAHGTIRAPRGESVERRLAAIHRALLEVIDLHRPDVASVEQVFVARGARAALVLGQARGVALAAVGWVAGLHPVYWIGIAALAGVLAWEHRLVRADDLSRIGAAFFNMNAVVSVVYFVTVVVAVALGGASA